MSHLTYLKYTETALLVVLGIAFWIVTRTISPNTDTVQLYTLKAEAPDQEFFKGTFKTLPATTQAAEVLTRNMRMGISPTCMSPEGSQSLAQNSMAAILAALGSLGQLGANLSMPNLTLPVNNPFESSGIMASPLCLCLSAVLDKFDQLNRNSAITQERIDSADKAYKACFSTNTHTPLQKQWGDVNYNPSVINTRKGASKVTFGLLIYLSLLFNVVYNAMDFENPNFYGKNVYHFILVGAVIGVQWLIPLVFDKVSHSATLMAMYSLIIAPAAVLEFGMMEIAWAYLYTNSRVVHIHPYAFVVTLISLNAIALFENGVFDFGTLIYYILQSHTLGLAYAATLFFTHFQKSNITDSHSLMGYVIVLATSALLVINGILPSHPTNGTLDLMTLLPWVFTICVFAFSILIEHTFKAKNVADDFTTHFTSHLYYRGYTILVLTVIVHFMLKHWHVTVGDTTLSNAGRVLSNYNFAFASGINHNIPSVYSTL